MTAMIKNYNSLSLCKGNGLFKYILFCLFLPVLSFADIRTSTALGGKWNSKSTWIGGVIPLAGDDVIIATSGTGAVIVDELITCLNLTISSNGRLIISGENTLNVVGVVNIPRPKSGFSSELNVGAGTLNVSGLFTMSATKGNRYTTLNITSGTVNLAGLKTGGTASRIIFEGAGILNLSGDLIGTGHTLDAGQGSVNFTGSSEQNVWAKNFYNLGVSGSGIKTLVGNATVTGTANIEAELKLNNHNLILSGPGTPLLVSGSINPESGSVIYSGENEQIVADIPYFNLKFNGTGSKKLTAGAKIIVAQDWNIESPTLIESDASIKVNRDMRGAGTLEMESGLLIIGNNNLRTGEFIPGSGTVQYNKAGDQTVRPVEYFNLVLSESGGKTIPEGKEIIINNDLEVSSDLIIPGTTELDINGNLTGTGDVILEEGVLSISGDWTNLGNLKSGNGTIIYDGNGDQLVAGHDYYNLETAEGGIKMLGDDVRVRNVLTVGEGTELNLDNHELTLSGSGIPLINNGIFNPAFSTVKYTNPDETEITAVNYHNLHAEGGPRKLSESDTISVSGKFNPGFGEYKTINSTVRFNGVNQTIPPFKFYHLILDGGGEKLVDSVINVKTLKIKNGSNIKLNSAGSAVVVITNQ